jgi:serine/threonine protein kinase/Tol biopolymer transport system component
MSLSAGTRLGPYEVVAPLGAGGMGEVYRARDERLKRDVAIKVLPASFSADADRLRRFEQEAQAAGSLNHPNILAIYDIGAHDGNPYIVSELLEGETLRDRLAGGALSPRKALGHALQIVRGLAAAHEKGIVHRDLKPENIFVTKDGRVKILDFGLAKLTRPEAGAAPVTQAPTETAGTEPGVALGTVGYMSPEQVRGHRADARSDIFSFGAILYEMLSGKRAFRGESPVETMSAILTKDPPDLSLTNQDISPGLERAVRHCLEKDPEQRFHSAHDLAFDLDALLQVSGSSPAASGVSDVDSRVWVRRAAVPLATAAALLIALGAVAGYRLARSVRSKSAPEGAVRAAFTQLTYQAGVENFPSLSPDGKTFLYVSAASGNHDIFLQRVDGRNAINLTRDCAQDDSQPAFSPDGGRIAFRSEREGGGIFLMGATGESVRRLTDFGFDPSWSPDGKEIAVAAERVEDPLDRRTTSSLSAVNAATGARRLITNGDAVQPSWSPHGHRIAYWGLPVGSGQRDIWTIPASGSPPGAGAVAVTSDAAVDWNPVWSPDGNFLYFSSDRNGTMNLWRVPIEEKSGRVLGDPEPLTAPSRWCGQLSISRDGRQVVYTSRDETSSIQRVAFDSELERVTGEPVPILAGSLLVRDINPSPDGKWVTFNTRGTQEDIFVVSSDGSSQRQLTNDAFKDRGPEWSPDGKRIAFYSNRGGRYEIWSVNADGSGLTQLTKTTGPGVWAPHWSPDGTRLAFPDGANTYLFTLGKPLGADTPHPLPPLNDTGTGFLARSWSPDGRALVGIATRRDGSQIPGVVLYWLELKKYQRLTDFGGVPTWMGDSRRLLVADPDHGKLLLLDSTSGRTVPLLDAPFDRNLLLSRIGIPSRDGRTIFFVKDHTEADIWQVTLK